MKMKNPALVEAYTKVAVALKDAFYEGVRAGTEAHFNSDITADLAWEQSTAKVEYDSVIKSAEKHK